MAVEQVSIGSWLRNVFAWDGLLPVGVVLIPIGIGLLLPNTPDAIAVTAVVVPIVAICIRFKIGKRHIDSHDLGEVVWHLQFCVFIVGIFLLMLLESLLIVVPLTDLFVREKVDMYSILLLFAIYLAAMAVAMFPGRSATKKSPDWSRPSQY